MKCLADKGANVNQADKDGATPLFCVADNGHLDVVKYLVGKSTDVNQAMANGATPLSIAAQEVHTGVVEYLLKAGADKSVKAQGWTALSIAESKGHRAVAALLGSSLYN